MSAPFQPGTIVDITIKGVRVHRDGGFGHTVFSLHDGPQITVMTAHPSVTIAPVAPAEWPPRIGDLWRDRSKNVWLAVGADSENELLMVRSIDGWRFLQEAAAEEFGPMTLVHREQDEAAPAEAAERVAELSGVALLRAVAAQLRDLNSEVWAELQSAPDRDPRYAPPFDPDAEYVRTLLLDLSEETARTPVLRMAVLMLPTLAHLLTGWLESVADEAEKHDAAHFSNCASEIADGYPVDIARIIFDALNGGEK